MRALCASDIEMIKTRYKEKVPKGFSYPIGAEKISEALAESMQGEACEISFWVKDEFWASSYTQRIKNREPIKIFDLVYSNPQTHHSSSQAMIDSGQYDPKWIIKVYAVPTTNVSAVKQLLKQEISEAAKWLKQPNAKNQSWQRFYDFKNGKLLPST